MTRILVRIATRAASRRSLLAIGVGLVLLALPTAVAHANGVPTIVKLSYIDGLSNWGPRDAAGTLELALGEGYAKLDATGLQRLSGQRYQGWLVNSQSNDAISVGTFNAAASGTVAHRGTLPGSADFGFDLFIVTVEPDPDDAPQPTAQRSIGGRFSLVGQRSADGTRGDPTGGGPRQLPNTGDDTWRSDLLRVGLLVAAAGASIGVGLHLGRRNA